jgi:hypothetical protein
VRLGEAHSNSQKRNVRGPNGTGRLILFLSVESLEKILMERTQVFLAHELVNTDGAIGGLTISDPPTQLEVQALRDKCEELADDVLALSTLVHALRGALVGSGLVKGGA